MNRYLILLYILTAVLSLASCSEDEAPDYMIWSADNRSEGNITYSCSIENGLPTCTINVSGKGGDIVLSCDNVDRLNPVNGNSNVYDCGWAILTTEGKRLICHFPENSTERMTLNDQISISANHGNRVLNSTISITRQFDDNIQEPMPGIVPDEYKFKLVKAAFSPFMNDNFRLAAPFDLITFRITDYYDNFSLMIPEYTEYYDSIVWCADGFPDTLKIYAKNCTSSSTEIHYSSQWSSYFFKSGRINHHLKGYRDGEVAYSTSLSTDLIARDFLCYDWTDGSIVLTNPTYHGVYCLLDRKYKYQASDTQEQNGTRFASIHLIGNDTASVAESLKQSKEALTELMTDNFGQAQDATYKVEAFKCLPANNTEIVKYWEIAATRIALLHRPSSDDRREKYYLHFESK